MIGDGVSLKVKTLFKTQHMLHIFLSSLSLYFFFILSNDFVCAMHEYNVSANNCDMFAEPLYSQSFDTPDTLKCHTNAQK